MSENEKRPTPNTPTKLPHAGERIKQKEKRPHAHSGERIKKMKNANDCHKIKIMKKDFNIVKNYFFAKKTVFRQKNSNTGPQIIKFSTFFRNKLRLETSASKSGKIVICRQK